MLASNSRLANWSKFTMKNWELGIIGFTHHQQRWKIFRISHFKNRFYFVELSFVQSAVTSISKLGEIDDWVIAHLLTFGCDCVKKNWYYQTSYQTTSKMNCTYIIWSEVKILNKFISNRNNLVSLVNPQLHVGWPSWSSWIMQ